MSNFGPIKLPSERTVIFREPKNADRRELLEGFGGEDFMRQNGKLEEALAYTCLLKVDDKDVTNLTWNSKSDLLNIRDGQFYQALFLQMFTIGKDDLNEIQQLAKKLLSPGTAKS